MAQWDSRAYERSYFDKVRSRRRVRNQMKLERVSAWEMFDFFACVFSVAMITFFPTHWIVFGLLDMQLGNGLDNHGPFFLVWFLIFFPVASWEFQRGAWKWLIRLPVLASPFLYLWAIGWHP